MSFHARETGLQRDWRIVGQRLAHQVLDLVELQSIVVAALGADAEPSEFAWRHILMAFDHSFQRAVDMVFACRPIVDRTAGMEVCQVSTRILVDRPVTSERMPQPVRAPAAHVDDGAFLELPHRHRMGIGRVVVVAAAVDVLTTVEVHHVEVAAIEHVSQSRSGLLEQRGFLVDDVPVDAPVHGVMSTFRLSLVGSRLCAPRSSLATKERIPLALRAD